ncbi:Auxin-responsive protein SAUR40 [Forsythia ovata]|uniref:Auxin-responsive protein SAUR40 n=1 Tax=Forsythia ovata TaxID=205694 RepID=A0ABD1U8D9_9LAMI
MGVKASKMSRFVSVRSVKRLKGPSMAPRGYIPVAVGVNDETKRFMVHTTALYDAEFLEFLCRSAEEYGFCSEGILRIPFDAKTFEERMSKGAKQKMFRVRPM